MPITRVLLVDDHPLFRQALAATVRQIDGTIVIEQYETLAAVCAVLAVASEPALVLLDLKLSDARGIAGLLSIKARAPNVPVAIVSASDDSETIQTVAACGAAGFISKSAGIDELCAAVEALIHGGVWFPETAEPTRAALTPTQTRILDGVQRGMMNKQIAFELGLTEATIKYHLTGLFRALGVQTRSQLLALSASGSTGQLPN